MEDFLPDYLTAFLLLQRSGLDGGERANILAAIHGRFTVDAVGRALKEQWNDEDLARRDKSKQNAFPVQDEAMMAEAPDRHQEPEAFAAFMEEQETINDAPAAIEHRRELSRKFAGARAN